MKLQTHDFIVYNDLPGITETLVFVNTVNLHNWRRLEYKKSQPTSHITA